MSTGSIRMSKQSYDSPTSQVTSKKNSRRSWVIGYKGRVNSGGSNAMYSLRLCNAPSECHRRRYHLGWRVADVSLSPPLKFCQVCLSWCTWLWQGRSGKLRLKLVKAGARCYRMWEYFISRINDMFSHCHLCGSCLHDKAASGPKRKVKVKGRTGSF